MTILARFKYFSLFYFFKSVIFLYFLKEKHPQEVYDKKSMWCFLLLSWVLRQSYVLESGSAWFYGLTNFGLDLCFYIVNELVQIDKTYVGPLFPYNLQDCCQLQKTTSKSTTLGILLNLNLLGPNQIDYVFNPTEHEACHIFITSRMSENCVIW